MSTLLRFRNVRGLKPHCESSSWNHNLQRAGKRNLQLADFGLCVTAHVTHESPGVRKTGRADVAFVHLSARTATQGTGLTDVALYVVSCQILPADEFRAAHVARVLLDGYVIE